MSPVIVRPRVASLLAVLLLSGVVQAEQPSPSPAGPPAVALNEQGFVVSSPVFKLRLGAILQVDGRAFIGDDAPNLTDTFLVRSARQTIDASLYELIDLLLMTDFGEGKAQVLDAYADLRLTPWLKLRLGKFKPAVGLERLQGERNTLFIERAFATSLVPNRDVGAQLQGDVARGGVAFALGVFNGAPDNTVGDNDTNESKDVVARLFLRPFRFIGSEALKNVGLGVAGSYGRQSGSAASPNLPSFKSPSQQTIFTYASSAVASGQRYRVAPQLHAYVGPFGLLSEYVVSSQRVSSATGDAQLNNQAWHVSASYVLTGESASYDGVVPAHPVSVEQGHPGAIELAVRYEELRVDAGAFPAFADATKSARQARAFDVGLNWYLSRNGRISLNFDRTDFIDGGASGPRQSENALLGRVQVAF